jgi:hypothetical protein
MASEAEPEPDDADFAPLWQATERSAVASAKVRTGGDERMRKIGSEERDAADAEPCQE